VSLPTPVVCVRLQAVLARHNPLEEGSDGLPAACDALAGDEADETAARPMAQPPVPTAAHYDGLFSEDASSVSPPLGGHSVIFSVADAIGARDNGRRNAL
jgi:hypothetical protein